MHLTLSYVKIFVKLIATIATARRSMLSTSSLPTPAQIAVAES